MKTHKSNRLLTVFWRHFRQALFNPSQFVGLLLKISILLKERGVWAIIQKHAYRQETYSDYPEWVSQYDILNDGDRDAIQWRISILPYKPLISVVMTVRRDAEGLLAASINSVINQIYPNWELLIAVDASNKIHIERVLENIQPIDRRIKTIFVQQASASLWDKALMEATGAFMLSLGPGDELSEHALYLIMEELNGHPDTDLLYSDSDRLDSSRQRVNPNLKPDWNPLLLLSQDFISRLAVYRTSLVKALDSLNNKEIEELREWELALRITEAIPSRHIRHIPHILYHASEIRAAAPDGNQYYDASRNLLSSHFLRTGQEVQLSPVANSRHWRIHYTLPTPPPLVSLIIPTRDSHALISRCIRSILEKTTYPNFEIIVVDNQTRERRTLDFLARLEVEGKARILRFDAPFNYSAINNLAARAARGPLLGLLNNDLEIISPDWLDEMVGYALQPLIGAVGAKLYYPDQSIQHAGTILGLHHAVAGHIFSHFPHGYRGPQDRARIPQNFSAITAACMILRREVFEEAGALDETLPITCNDIDLCLRIRGKGYFNAWTPYAELYHHESASRGFDDTLEKQARYQKEMGLMRQRWGAALLNDPAYNPNLTLDSGNFALAFPPRAKKPWQTSHRGLSPAR